MPTGESAGLAVTADSFDDLLGDCLRALRERGQRISVSRGSCIELRGALLVLTNPLARLSRSFSRGRLFSALGELTWYLSGKNDQNHILYYIPSYATQIGDFSGAYGPRLFGDGDDGQVHRVIEQLRSKPNTRQAVIQLFDRSDLNGNPKDIPCTCTLQFFVRNNKVELIVHMRSNDVIYGLPHDVFAFTFLQELVARALGLNLGAYTHMVGSLHLYDDGDRIAEAFLEEGAMADIPMPPMPEGDPWPDVQTFLNSEAALRHGNRASVGASLPGYWRELVDVLVGWQAFRNDDAEALRVIRERLTRTVYGMFLSDKYFALERDAIA